MSTPGPLRFVRGEADWHAIVETGASVTFRHDRVEFFTPPGLGMHTVEALDLIQGLRSHLAEPEALRRWGQVVLGVDLFDFAPIESTPGGDAVLSLVWDVAFGKVPTEKEIDTLHRRLLRSGR